MEIHQLSQDVTTLQHMLLEQYAVIEALTKKNAALMEKNAELIGKIDALEHRLNQLLRQEFGQRSERKSNTSTGEGTRKKKSEQNTRLSNNTKESDTQRKPKRSNLPKDLPRVDIEYDIDEKHCSDCGNSLKSIGCETSEQLEYIPAKLQVIRHIRHKYACPHCTGFLKTARLPDQPIDKGIPSPSLLAQLVIDKYQDSLPLYRQEDRWKRLGYRIARSSMCGWIEKSAFLLEAIVECLQKGLFERNKINTDDTIIPVQSPEEKGKTKKGRLWVYIADGDGLPAIAIYHYSPARTQKEPVKFLSNYKGYLQADAYPGYDRLYKKGHIIEVACWAHCRRKFYDIQVASPGTSLADDALEYIGQLYGIEKRVKKMNDDQRKYYRKHYAKPILKEFRKWLVKEAQRTLPQSPIRKAINYALNHWRALLNYMREGYLDIDNNRAERAMKPIVIGRKNYLFAGSDEGAKRASIIYSLIETCKLNGINTFDYIKSVLTRLPSCTQKTVSDLLPHNWAWSEIKKAFFQFIFFISEYGQQHMYHP